MLARFDTLATFLKRRETTQPSRLGHLLATPAAFDQPSSSSVDEKQEGSQH